MDLGVGVIAFTMAIWFGWTSIRSRRVKSVDLTNLNEAWIWGTDEDVTAVLKIAVGSATRIQRASRWLLLISSPLNATLLVGVFTYRRFFRVRTLAPVCMFNPSCSGYAVGMLRRHPAWVALPQIVRRLRACNGHQTGVDLQPHLQVTETATAWRAGA